MSHGRRGSILCQVAPPLSGMASLSSMNRAGPSRKSGRTMECLTTYETNSTRAEARGSRDAISMQVDDKAPPSSKRSAAYGYRDSDDGVGVRVVMVVGRPTSDQRCLSRSGLVSLASSLEDSQQMEAIPSHSGREPVTTLATPGLVLSTCFCSLRSSSQTLAIPLHTPSTRHRQYLHACHHISH